MGRNKKAAIATCASAALSSLNTTGPMSLVTIRNGAVLASPVRESKRASLRRQYCPSSSCAGAGESLTHLGRSVRYDRDRVVSDAMVSGGSPAQPAPGLPNSTPDCVDNVAQGQRNGAPHSLSAPGVKRGNTTAGEDLRLSGSKQAARASVPGLDK